MEQKKISTWFGIALIVLSAFLICKMAWVHSGWFGLRIGRLRLNSGFAILPLLFGITLILRNPKTKSGYLLALIGVILLALMFLSSLHISFHHTSLFNLLLVMLCLFVGISLLIKKEIIFK